MEQSLDNGSFITQYFPPSDDDASTANSDYEMPRHSVYHDYLRYLHERDDSAFRDCRSDLSRSSDDCQIKCFACFQTKLRLDELDARLALLETKWLFPPTVDGEEKK